MSKKIHLNNRHQLPPPSQTEEHHVHEIFGFLVHIVTWDELLSCFDFLAKRLPGYLFLMIHHPYFGKYLKMMTKF